MFHQLTDGNEFSAVLTGSHAFVQLLVSGCVALRVCVLLVVVVVASNTTVWISRRDLATYDFLWGVCGCFLSLWWRARGRESRRSFIKSASLFCLVSELGTLPLSAVTPPALPLSTISAGEGFIGLAAMWVWQL